MGNEVSNQVTIPTSRSPVLRKTPTGIQGVDELTGGGLPKGRSTLLCGGAGSGKTLLAMEFLVRGAKEFGEPGVFIAFEERIEELVQNSASLGHDLRSLTAEKKLAIDHVSTDRSETSESGGYDLGGLFIRLEHAIDSIGAGRVVVDSIEALFAGLTGTGKTSLAAHFPRAATEAGERCLWFVHEESASQVLRNMSSIGLDLAPAVRSGMLRLQADPPTIFGLEMHLLTMHKLVKEFKPRNVILDSISNFTTIGSEIEIEVMPMRLINLFKTQQITSLFTSLTTGDTPMEDNDTRLSSLVDTWILLREIESGAERNRVLHLLKSRGMAHSNQIREFLLTDHGVALRDVYLGPSGVLLTGSALLVQQAHDQAQSVLQEQEAGGRKRELEHKREVMEAQVAALRAGFEIEQVKALRSVAQDDERATVLTDDRVQMAKQRQADARNPKKAIRNKARGS